MFVFFSSFLFSQETYLWKVTSKNGKNTSYLFGTMHLMGESFYNKYPNLDKALKASDMVITEVEINRSELIKRYSNRPISDDLEKNLTPEEFRKIKEIFKDYHTDFRKLYPNEITQKLQVKLVMKSCSSFNPADQYLLDEYIQKAGKDAHQEMYYLETINEQYNYMGRAKADSDSDSDSMTWKSAKSAIKTVLKQYDKTKTYCPSLVENYALLKYSYDFNKSCERLNDHDAILQRERNDNWMKVLPGLFEKNNVFAAVGLDHFAYQCGLIQQLRNLGYSVEPVPMK